MKRILCLCLTITSLIVKGQTTETTGSQGEPVYHDVSGSQYVLPDWCDGVIRFSSGRVATQFKLKFDCIKNQINMQFQGSSFVTESKVKEFVIFPKAGNKKDSMVFRKGFPPYETANEETYYEVLLEGKQTLIKLHLKYVTEEPQIASKIVYRRFKDEPQYYLVKDKKLYLLAADKLLVGDSFPDHKEEIQKFITDQQLKFRDNTDYIKLVTYYNGL